MKVTSTYKNEYKSAQTWIKRKCKIYREMLKQHRFCNYSGHETHNTQTSSFRNNIFHCKSTVSYRVRDCPVIVTMMFLIAGGHWDTGRRNIFLWNTASKRSRSTATYANVYQKIYFEGNPHNQEFQVFLVIFVFGISLNLVLYILKIKAKEMYDLL